MRAASPAFQSTFRGRTLMVSSGKPNRVPVTPAAAPAAASSMSCIAEVDGETERLRPRAVAGRMALPQYPSQDNGQFEAGGAHEGGGGLYPCARGQCRPAAVKVSPPPAGDREEETMCRRGGSGTQCGLAAPPFLIAISESWFTAAAEAKQGVGVLGAGVSL